jgi:hypothetical protein
VAVIIVGVGGRKENLFQRQQKSLNFFTFFVLCEDKYAMIYDIERIYNDGPTKNFKLLGVLTDEHLSFEDHINNLCTKISKSLFCTKRIKNFVNQDTKKTLYYAMIHSHLVYCINIYSCATDTCLNKLKLKQK